MVFENCSKINENNLHNFQKYSKNYLHYFQIMKIICKLFTNLVYWDIV